MADGTHPSPAGAQERLTGSARQLGRAFALFYIQATVVAVSVSMVLALIGLEFNAHQWWSIIATVPLAAITFMSPDIWLIARHYRPLRLVLEKLDARQPVAPDDARAALVRALNLPFYAFARVTFLHGPLAAFSGWWCMLLANRVMDAGFQTWQMWIFPSLILFFASPGHAIVEFFRLSRELAPVIRRLWPHCEGSFAGVAEQPIAIRLQSKLLYLCFFITALPLGFVAFSIIFKIDLLLRKLGVTATPEMMQPIWLWIYSVITVCLIGAVAMSVLTAREVSRSAARLIGGMNDVERGNLGADLEITATDEYADLYRGFNLMVDGLRDEARMMEVSQDLAGELQLEVLIARILAAATELLDADRSTLFMHDADRRELWSHLAEGLKVREIRVPDTAGISGAVFQTGKPENIADAYADPRFNQDVDRRTGYRTRSILCMPITTKAGKRIGVTQVLNKQGGGSFTAKDEQRLSAFTAQIAVTLENAQLFDEVLAVKNYNENILASTSNGVITLDNARAVVTVNAAAQRILGLEFADTGDRAVQDAFTSANPWVVKSVAKVQATGLNDVIVDAELAKPDGSVAAVNLTTVPLRNAQGESLGTMLNFEDFTREKRVKSTMSRYMSKEVAEQLLEAGEAALGGQLQTVSVLFADVRGFTSLAETVGAKETVSLLNEYFEQMVEVVFQHKGILDKYIGDALMALFGSPFVSPEDADRAVATANDMLVALAALNRRRSAEGHAPLEVGIGIATGDVIVGNIGSPRRMEYTVIGDGVNLAARLESATKHYGVRVLLSESTVSALKQPIALREIDRIRVKGKDHAVTVYEALGHHDARSFPGLAECRELWQAAIAAYRRLDFAAAEEGFRAVLAHNPADRPSQIYLDRCAYYASHSPPQDWDYVWNLREK